MQFIIAHSDVDFSLFGPSHALSNPNGYHNFGHQIGVAESAIKIAEAEWLSRKEINLLVVAALLHDAGHTWVTTLGDEMASVELAIRFLPADVYQKLWFTPIQLRDLILATAFSQRGKYNRNLAKILQDADISGSFFGPYYRLYATIGLVDEFGIDYRVFIREEQQKFLNYLNSISPGCFLSEGAKKVCSDPQKSLDMLLSRPDEVIDYAYKVRRDDILFADFEKELQKLINEKWIMKN